LGPSLNATASENLVDSARYLVVEEVRVRSVAMRAVEVEVRLATRGQMRFVLLLRRAMVCGRLMEAVVQVLQVLGCRTCTDRIRRRHLAHSRAEVRREAEVELIVKELAVLAKVVKGVPAVFQWDEVMAKSLAEVVRKTAAVGEVHFQGEEVLEVEMAPVVEARDRMVFERSVVA
jgi:hypothetical protein